MLPLTSHAEYADGTDRQTHRHQTVTLRFPLNADSVITQRVSWGKFHRFESTLIKSKNVYVIALLLGLYFKRATRKQDRIQRVARLAYALYDCAFLNYQKTGYAILPFSG